jgi:hypothetical protein
MPSRAFSDATLAAIRKSLVIGIRAGDEPHRFVAVWAVVVGKRVFARSWSLSRNGWHAVLAETPRGAIEVNGKTLRVRTVQTRSEQVKDAVDRAYRETYPTPGSAKYVRDLCRAKSKATTTELVPL